jgi:hypothetical protein
VTEPRSTTSAAGGPVLADEPYERRWLALGVIAMTVLLVILDATIVNIALPAVTADLGISAASQQWIVTAYTLTFGGFLLLGGRIADFWGRKRTYRSARPASPSPRRSAVSRRTRACCSPPGRCRVCSARCWPRRRSHC